MIPLGIVGFVAVGLALGLLGGGGSILAVPVLVYLMGIDPTTAVAMSLPVVGTTALAGAWLRWRRGELDLRTVAVFAPVAMAAGFVAARAGATLDDDLRLLLFAGTMLAAAVAMWRRAGRPAAPAGPPRPAVWFVLPALLVGLLTGLVGVGGGFVIVPVLVAVAGLPLPRASATSLAVIALNAAATGAGYLGRVTFDPGLTAAIIGAALAGMVAGTALAPRIRAGILARAFAVLLVVLGVFIVVERLRA